MRCGPASVNESYDMVRESNIERFVKDSCSSQTDCYKKLRADGVVGMTPVNRFLKKAGKTLLGERCSRALKRKVGRLSRQLEWMFLPQTINVLSRRAKRVVMRPIPNGPVLHLHSYSAVNDRALLRLCREVCFGKQDIRAGWIGAGLPNTDAPDYQPLARWATQHWAMYSGFLPLVRPNCSGGRILDVGSGTGHATVCLGAIFQGMTVTGIDNDGIATRFAEKMNQRSNVRYVRDDFLSFESGQRYAYIFALEIMEHLPATLHNSFIDRCLSMLDVGGRLFVTTPNALDEPDGSYGHTGLLSRARANSFIEKYSDRMRHASFYDNHELLSGDPAKFIVNDPVSTFADKDGNRSHFRFVMA